MPGLLQLSQRLLESSPDPQGPAVFEERQRAPIRLAAVEQSGVGRRGSGRIALLESTASHEQGSLLGEVAMPRGEHERFKRLEGPVAIIDPDQRRAMKQPGLVGPALGRMADDDGFCLDRDLTPQALGLIHPPLALGLAGAPSQLLGVIHAIVIRTASAEEEQHGEDEAPHRPPPGAALPVLRSYSRR